MAPLWRALGIYRMATVVYVVAAYAFLAEYYARPGLGWGVVAGIAMWTVIVTGLYRDPRRRTPAVLVTDLAIAALAIALNPVVDSSSRIDAGEPTLALIWPSGALLAWAAQWGWRGGLAAGAVLSTVSITARGELTRSTGNNILLLLLAGLLVGYAVDLFRDSQRALGRALRLDAATRERERLSRSIHDGVLQVLALVQRRGPDLGPEGAELARLAEEQQEAVRQLLIEPSAEQSDDDPQIDVAQLVRTLASAQVTVAAPADPVWLPDHDAAELLLAIEAALDNVRRHVAGDAPAWVLVECDDAALTVSIRDEGPGVSATRLRVAREAGRLGVDQSIRGRLRDLGGRAEIISRPGSGTEVELTLPLRES
ncbi:MAG: MacS family sensor histidine kinase [Actinomycetes bacterium]